jgi:hypothetical protein
MNLQFSDIPIPAFAFVATLLPARRGARADPVLSLRS